MSFDFDLSTPVADTQMCRRQTRPNCRVQQSATCWWLIRLPLFHWSTPNKQIINRQQKTERLTRLTGYLLLWGRHHAGPNPLDFLFLTDIVRYHLINLVWGGQSVSPTCTIYCPEQSSLHNAQILKRKLHRCSIVLPISGNYPPPCTVTFMWWNIKWLIQ